MFGALAEIASHLTTLKFELGVRLQGAMKPSARSVPADSSSFAYRKEYGGKPRAIKNTENPTLGANSGKEELFLKY